MNVGAVLRVQEWPEELQRTDLRVYKLKYGRTMPTLLENGDDFRGLEWRGPRLYCLVATSSMEGPGCSRNNVCLEGAPVCSNIER